MAGGDDISFTSQVRAERLRFRAPPRTQVRFDGPPGGVSRSTSSRTNLPDPVTPGVDYHGVRVDYVLSNRLAPRATPARRAEPPGGAGRTHEAHEADETKRANGVNGADRARREAWTDESGGTGRPS